MDTQKEDLIWIREQNLIDEICNSYLDLKDVNSIEIVSSYENESFVLKLKTKLLLYGVKNVYISYTNGIIEEEFVKGYEYFLEKRISFYKQLINEKFVRIKILSPFSIPLPLTDNIINYQKNINRLKFVSDYLIQAQRLMIVKPSLIWANQINLSLESFWDIISKMNKDSLDDKLDIINNLNLKGIKFISDEGTNCFISLNKNHPFIGSKLNIGNKTFSPNVPSREIFSTPNKYGSYGTIVMTKPLYYHGKLVKDISITLENGYIISNKNLDFLLEKEESLKYLGEVALCNYMDNYFYCPLLDENTGCHIAIGNGYPYFIDDLSNINKSNYHIDLVFGSDSLKAIGIKEDDSEIILMEKGMVII